MAEEELLARQAEGQEPEEATENEPKAQEAKADPEKPQATATVAKRATAKP